MEELHALLAKIIARLISGRARHAGSRSDPPDRDLGADLLPLEEAVRRLAVRPGARQLKQLQDENGRLKKLVAELSFDKAILQDIASKKWPGPR